MVLTFIHRMLCMSMGGALTLSDVPGGGNIKWLKSLNISKGMLRIFNSSMVFALDGANVSCLI